MRETFWPLFRAEVELPYDLAISFSRQTLASVRGLGFESQHSHGGSQPPVTPVRGDPTAFWPPWALHA